jgi:hypothetical protein
MSQPTEPNRPQPPDPEEVTRLLKEGARKRRPRTCAGLLFWFVVLAVPVGLLAWWFRPRPVPPHLLVLTFDEVAVPGKTVTLRAQLLPAADEAADVPLGGREVFFLVGPTVPPAAGRAGWQDSAAGDDAGAAAVRWQAPGHPEVVPFTVRLPGGRSRSNVEDRGRVFTCSPNTPLLVVPAESALTDAPPDAWRKLSAADIPRLAGAADALSRAQKEGRYQVVYLALRADRPPLYRKVRDWVQQVRPAGKEKPLPLGPVLGRPAYTDNQSEAAARKEVLGRLRTPFKGRRVAVTREAREAQAFRALGFEAFLVAGGKAPAGVRGVASWAELPAKLKAARK